MRRLPPVLLAAVFFLAGCVTGPGDSDAPDDPAEPRDRTHVNVTHWLKPGHRLSPTGPASDEPQPVPVPPGQNAYVNEDLVVWSSEPIGGTFVATSARLVVHYEVDAPVADPFVTGQPPDGRLFVFWLGADGVLPGYAQTYEDAVLVPGQTYTADVDIPLPEGGLVLGLDRTLDLLPIATASQQEDELRLLVDHESTPSRLELSGYTTEPPFDVPAPREVVNKTVTIPGNGGLFTGAMEGDDSQHREPFELPENTTYLRIEVRFLETTGPKADLDLWMYDEAGSEIAASTTAFQSETIELWPPNLADVAAGDHTALINAYSGQDTRFRLRILVQ